MNGCVKFAIGASRSRPCTMPRVVSSFGHTYVHLSMEPSLFHVSNLYRSHQKKGTMCSYCCDSYCIPIALVRCNLSKLDSLRTNSQS